MWSTTAGIIAVRYIFLPILGTLVVKGAIHIGWVNSDPLYQFVLLLQYALPPAMGIGNFYFEISEFIYEKFSLFLGLICLLLPFLVIVNSYYFFMLKTYSFKSKLKLISVSS